MLDKSIVTCCRKSHYFPCAQACHLGSSNSRAELVEQLVLPLCGRGKNMFLQATKRGSLPVFPSNELEGKGMTRTASVLFWK